MGSRERISVVRPVLGIEITLSQGYSRLPVTPWGRPEMAYYKDLSTLLHTCSSEFDVTHAPGAIPPHSGIYRCQGCGVEIVAEQRRSFPPTQVCSQHHSPGKTGHVLWKMIVYARHKDD